MKGSDADEDKGNDKLRHGPCNVQYKLVEQCAAAKRLIEDKQKLEECPNETDLLIRCIGKHPKFFHSHS